MLAGIDLIEWTFDPLEIKNAFFNIERLGAIVRRYVQNQYGTPPAICMAACRPTAALPNGGSGLNAQNAIGEGRSFLRNPIEARLRCLQTSPNWRSPIPLARLKYNSPSPSSFRSTSTADWPSSASRKQMLGQVPARRMGIKIDRVVLRQIRMPLVHFFETSFGRTYERDIMLVEVISRRRLGLGRSHRRRESFLQRGVDRFHLAAADTIMSRRACSATSSRSPKTSIRVTAHIRGHNMARGGLEAAVWDLEARLHGQPLWKQIGGGARREIPCGVSIGIQDTVDATARKRSRPSWRRDTSASR